MMAADPPVVLGAPRATSVIIMAVLLALFVLRVLGQIVAATVAPRWLPPMARWYSGVMPYGYLLPTQVIFIVVMTAIIAQVASRHSPLGAASHTAGVWIIWASYAYALAMAIRAARYAAATPERRGVLIPIVFHFVLAAFLFVWGSTLIA